MKQLLRNSIDAAVARLLASGELTLDGGVDYQVETPKRADHGDFSTNIAMLLAKPLRRAPRDIAAALCDILGTDELFDQVDIAGPGFINFTVANEFIFAVLDEIDRSGVGFGSSTIGAGRKIQVEFVSANPTGPLHIGHGRGAAIGSVMANLLTASGFDVCREYYVNDAGRQMDILAMSVFLRYLQSCDHAISFPQSGYQGDYIAAIAASYGAQLPAGGTPAPNFSAAADEDDQERVLDLLISAVRTSLGDAAYAHLRGHATHLILEEIRHDLEAFGVRFDVWYSEASLAAEGHIDTAIGQLENNGHLYTKDGARWFRSQELGDEKDRVIVRENGQKTYFASDIAYHMDKFERGFTQIIDVWGADHHGYVPRVKAAIQALGADPQALDIVLVQFASLVRGGEKVAMSTRSGEFVTLRQLIDEVGVDAARFFYVMRRADQHLEFDLDLATAQSNDNPVYYVQYAHARICSVFRQLRESPFENDANATVVSSALQTLAERKLAMLLATFPDLVTSAAMGREPHALTQYLRDLAQEFHAYYNSNKILVDDGGVRTARLHLIAAVRQVLANGLALLGISAPESM